MSGTGSGIAGNQGQSSFAALELLANPTQLQAKIDSLKAAEESAKEMVTLAGPAHEILQLREKTGQLHDEATETLSAAHNQAESIVNAAEEKADKIVNDALKEADQIAAAADEMTTKSEAVNQAALEVSRKSLNELKEIEQREEKLADSHQELAKYGESLDELESLLLQEKSKLATVREQINSVLE